MFSIENAVELIIIGMALLHSGFARLPIMVAISIILYSIIVTLINYHWPVEVSPGFEMYYVTGSIYFIVMGGLFLTVKDRLYMVIATCLIIQGMFSAAVLLGDAFQISEPLYKWHEFVNSKILLVECICVWLSALRFTNESNRSS